MDGREGGAGRVRACLDAVLRYADDEGYRGYDEHDALNSPILERLSLGVPLLRLAFAQLVMRFPSNLRPLLGVRKGIHPEGLSLFARAWLERSRFHGAAECLGRARAILEWLRKLACGYFPGIAWGHPYPWQDKGFFAPRHFPNRVVTCFCGEAFADAWDLAEDPRDRDAVAEVARFLTEAPGLLLDNGDGAWVTYVPVAENRRIVLDVSALTGAFLARAGRILGDEGYREIGRKLIAYVAGKQTEEGAWPCAHPPRASHARRHDHRMGLILDSILAYARDTGDEAFLPAYRRGLAFYAEKLFLPDGAPRWMSHRTYPHDIRGAAQGILAFSRAAAVDPSYGELSARILDWTIENLYDPRGFFYYRKGRLRTKRFPLLGRANGWMALAMATALGRVLGRPQPARPLEAAVDA